MKPTGQYGFDHIRKVTRELQVAQSRTQTPLNESGVNPTDNYVPQKSRVYTVAVTRLIADAALLSIAALTGFLVNVYLFGDDPTVENREVALWIPLLFVISSVFLLKVAGSNQHSSQGYSIKDWAQTAGIISFATAIVWGITEITLSQQPNGEVAAAVWGSAIVLIPIGRSLVGVALRSRGIGCRRVVVVGEIDQALPVMKRLDRNGSSFRVVGMISPGLTSFSPQNIKTGNTPGQSALDSLPDVIQNAGATDLLIAVSNSEYSRLRDTIRTTVPTGVTVHVALNPLLDAGSEGVTEIVDGVPAVRFRGKSMPWQYETVKRVFDITAALVLLVLASPLLAAVAVMIKLDSPGPVFFKQVRVGRRGSRFGMYKFRSMRVNAEDMLDALVDRNEAGGKMFKMKDDPRVTRLGKIIRKLSADELPQLFNVLNGSMSLVGPRPPLPREVADYEDRHFERLDGIPGITGLWQIKRGPVLDFEEMVRFDLEYLSNWALWKDIVIMLRTIPVVITGRGSY